MKLPNLINPEKGYFLIPRPWRLWGLLILGGVVFANARLYLFAMAALVAVIWGIWMFVKKHSFIIIPILLVGLIAVGLWGFTYYEMLGVKDFADTHRSEIPALVADGVYFGEAEGMRGPVKARVEVEDGRITDIAIRHVDSQNVGENAARELSARIIATQNPDQDALAGATRSSAGILGAVENALWEGVNSRPHLSFLSNIIYWVAYNKFDIETLNALAILFIIGILADYTWQSIGARGTGQSLNCMDCQTCVGVCPVKTAEGELFPMRLVLAARLGDYEKVERLSKYCVGCGKCTGKCPAGISAPAVIAGTLELLHSERTGYAPPAKPEQKVGT
jgi:uncharacterized protein with FMN-binding domain/ferredoxin